LLRRVNTGWDDSKLILPGGHLEEGETALEAAIREVEEELGLALAPERFRLFAIGNVLTNHEYVVHEFAVEQRDGEEPVNKESNKCAELVWCDPTHLPEDVSEVFRVIIEKGYLGKQPYIEFGYSEA